MATKHTIRFSDINQHIEDVEVLLASQFGSGHNKQLMANLKGEYIVYHNKKEKLKTKVLVNAICQYNEL